MAFSPAPKSGFSIPSLPVTPRRSLLNSPRFEHSPSMSTSASEFDAAIDELRRADSDMATPIKFIELGIIARNTGKVDASINLFSSAIDLNKNMEKAYFHRAMSYRLLNDFDKSIADYTKCFYINKKNALAVYNRANVLVLKGMLSPAIVDYGRAISIMPNFTDAYINRAVVGLRVENVTAKQVHTACLDLEKAASVNQGDDALCYFYIGCIFHQPPTNTIPMDIEEALTAYTKAATADICFAKTFINRCVLMFKKQCYDEALSDIDHALTLTTTDAIALNNKGVIMEYFNISILAMSFYKQAMTSDEAEVVPYAFYNYGRLFLMNKDSAATNVVDVKQAYDALLKVIALLPTDLNMNISVFQLLYLNLIKHNVQCIKNDKSVILEIIAMVTRLINETTSDPQLQLCLILKRCYLLECAGRRTEAIESLAASEDMDDVYDYDDDDDDDDDDDENKLEKINKLILLGDMYSRDGQGVKAKQCYNRAVIQSKAPNCTSLLLSIYQLRLNIDQILLLLTETEADTRIEELQGLIEQCMSEPRFSANVTLYLYSLSLKMIKSEYTTVADEVDMILTQQNKYKSHMVSCVTLAYLLKLRGNVCGFMGDMNEASYYERSLSLCPRYWEAWNDFAVAVGDAEGIQALIHAAEITDYTNLSILYNLGTLYLLMNQYSNAQDTFAIINNLITNLDEKTHQIDNFNYSMTKYVMNLSLCNVHLGNVVAAEEVMRDHHKVITDLYEARPCQGWAVRYGKHIHHDYQYYLYNSGIIYQLLLKPLEACTCFIKLKSVIECDGCYLNIPNAIETITYYIAITSPEGSPERSQALHSVVDSLVVTDVVRQNDDNNDDNNSNDHLLKNCLYLLLDECIKNMEYETFYQCVEDLLLLEKSNKKISSDLLLRRGLHCYGSLAWRARACDDVHQAFSLAPDSVEAMVSSGLIHLYQQHYADAQTLLLQALPLSSINDVLLTKTQHGLVATYIYLNQPSFALDILLQLTNKNNDDSMAWYNIGIVYELLNNDTDAIDAYCHCFLTQSKEAARNLQRCLLRQGDIDSLSTAVSLTKIWTSSKLGDDGDSQTCMIPLTTLYLHRGLVLLNHQLYDAARLDYEAVINDATYYDTGITNEDGDDVYLYLTLCWLFLGDVSIAKSYYQRSSSASLSAKVIGALCNDLSLDIPSAITIYTSILPTNLSLSLPSTTLESVLIALVSIRCAQLYQHTKNYELILSLQSLQQLCDHSTLACSIYMNATFQVAPSINVCATLTSRTHPSIMCLFQNSVYKYQLGLITEALQDWSYLIKLSKDDEEILNKKSIDYDKTCMFNSNIHSSNSSNSSSMLRNLLWSVIYKEGSAGEVRALALVHRGRYFNSIHNWHKSDADFRRALDLDSANVDAMCERVYLASKRGFPSLVIQLYQQYQPYLSTIIETNTDIAYLYIQSLIRCKEFSQALEHMSSLLLRCPWTVRGWLLRGCLNRHLCNFDKAIDDLNMALTRLSSDFSQPNTNVAGINNDNRIKENSTKYPINFHESLPLLSSDNEVCESLIVFHRCLARMAIPYPSIVSLPLHQESNMNVNAEPLLALPPPSPPLSSISLSAPSNGPIASTIVVSPASIIHAKVEDDLSMLIQQYDDDPIATQGNGSSLILYLCRIIIRIKLQKFQIALSDMNTILSKFEPDNNNNANNTNNNQRLQTYSTLLINKSSLLLCYVEALSSAGVDDNATLVNNAIECCKQGLSYHTNCLSAWFNLATLYIIQNNYNEAETCYQQVIHHPLDTSSTTVTIRAMAHDGLGMLFIQQARYEDALIEFSAAIVLSSTTYSFYRHRVLAMSNLNTIHSSSSSSSLSSSSSVYQQPILADMTLVITMEPTNPINYLIRGRLYKLFRQLKEADDDFTAAFTLLSSSSTSIASSLLCERGMLREEASMFSEACSDYLKCIDMNKTTTPDPLVLKGYARCRLKQGDAASVEIALQTLTKVLEVVPDDVEALACYGSLLLLGNGCRGGCAVPRLFTTIPNLITPQKIALTAWGCLSSAVSSNKRNAYMNINMSSAAFLAGDSAAATTAISAVLSNSKSSPLVHAYALYNRGLIKLQSGDHKGAIVDFKGIEKQNAIDNVIAAVANVGLAIAFIQQGKWEEALEPCDTAIALSPSLPYAYFCRASVRHRLHQQGDVDDMIRVLEIINTDAAMTDLRILAYWNLGICRFRRDMCDDKAIDDLDHALEHFNEGSDNNSESIKISITLARGIMSESFGYINDALKDYLTVAESGSGDDSATAWLRLGTIFAEGNEHITAMMCLSKARSIKARRSDILEAQAQLLWTMGDIKLSVKALSMAASLGGPRESQCLFAQGVCRQLSDDLPNAIIDYTAALHITPALVAALNNRGVCFLQSNRVNDAIRDFSQAIDIDSQNKIVLQNMSMVWDATGTSDITNSVNELKNISRRLDVPKIVAEEVSTIFASPVPVMTCEMLRARINSLQLRKN